MLDTLLKKACGYTYEEVTKEYGIDDEGNTKLIKQKVVEKYVPPDVSALKAYVELSKNELFEMTDEELKQEKIRLLNELAELNKGAKNERKGNSKKH